MTLNSSTGNGSTSIFENGKLRPGIYKIQSICTDTYLDIEVHSRGVCCRPAKDLGEGRGLVRRYPSSVVHASDNSKWEIKQLGPGYTVQRVSLPGHFTKFRHTWITSSLVVRPRGTRTVLHPIGWASGWDYAAGLPLSCALES